MSITLSTAHSNERSNNSFGIPFHDPEIGRELPNSVPQIFRSLREYGVRQVFARNEVIFAEGESAHSVYKLMSGTVRLCRHTAEGRRHIADFLLDGDVFGLGENPNHAFTAQSVDVVTLTAYPKTEFNKLVASSAEVRSLVMAHLETDLATAQHHHFVLSCQNAKERVASFLLRLAARMDMPPSERIDLPMGRQDIADHLGLTIETVCRALSMLKSAGIVTVPNAHQVILNDMRGLRDLAIAA